MNAEETLKKIASVVGIKLGNEEAAQTEVKLEEVALEDGTKIRANAMEAGEAVFVVTPDGDIPMPEGAYMTADGMTLVVDGAGLIKEVKQAEKEEETAEVATEEVTEPEMEAEAGAPTPKKITETISQETLYAEIEKVRAEFDAKLAEAVQAKEEAVQENEKLQAQLSEITEAMKEPFTETPPVHNPEKRSSKVEMQQWSTRRTLNTQDRVMAKIANLKLK